MASSPETSSAYTVLIHAFETIVCNEPLYTAEEMKTMCFRAYNLRSIDEDVRSTRSFEEWIERNKPRNEDKS